MKKYTTEEQKLYYTLGILSNHLTPKEFLLLCHKLDVDPNTLVKYMGYE